MDFKNLKTDMDETTSSHLPSFSQKRRAYKTTN
jgi:hypothetical protein